MASGHEVYAAIVCEEEMTRWLLLVADWDREKRHPRRDLDKLEPGAQRIPELIEFAANHSVVGSS